MTCFIRLALLSSLTIFPLLSAPAGASTGDIGTIIENFVTKQFPDAASHFWVVNETQWDGDEMIVDVNAIVVPPQQPEPVANRFLLLIVAGKLEAAQSIPLDAVAECQREEEV
ncbi:hypothetical protein FBQ96_13375 [Nitrospirales bacterium NOB]|nr:MAG: hypothetical protein UZ03_NOB001003520 [Nitrospira sp. OLB3]MBV6468479.1 hypothetical protein [Nitrospirota bacterium]MCE7965290.1 hypothetical protein [Nitrospira sp. NTP2]MCK6494299.1 hypothetical protein [Nitrospira sp.]MDL1890544.1 hypothetical protein [Nitrospirales bacterium NOB]MEB2339533.1 hypothetical protein [Nitrospirales bacterium]